MMKKESDGIFDYPYFSETVRIYNYLTNKYPDKNIYFSKFLDKPSVCLETKKKKYTFYVAENSVQNNEVWLFNSYEDLPHKTSGFGYGEKMNDIEKQLDLFLKDLKEEKRQMSIFDFMEGENGE